MVELNVIKTESNRGKLVLATAYITHHIWALPHERYWKLDQEVFKGIAMNYRYRITISLTEM